MSLDKASPKFAARSSLLGGVATATASKPDFYPESSESYVTHLTVLEEFRLNVKQLEQLHARLSFMMGEVRELVKK